MLASPANVKDCPLEIKYSALMQLPFAKTAPAGNAGEQYKQKEIHFGQTKLAI